ncbi:MAG TPA: serine hydrolase [Polyangiaceae bacterium]
MLNRDATDSLNLSARRLLAMGAMIIGMQLAGCSNQPASDDQSTQTGFVWHRSAPEAQGLDSSRLEALMTDIAAGDYGVHSLLIVRHGNIVLEANFYPYDGVRPHDIASCTKSLTSLAVGVALGEGQIASVDDTLADHLPERTFDDPRKGAITLDNLLTMRSGLSCESDAAALTSMTSAPDWIGYALGLPLTSAPGATWQYCGLDAHLLSGVVTTATGLAEDELLQRTVFSPLQIERPIWPRDPQGVSHGWGDARFHAQDLARLGLLLLQKGAWDGAQLVDAEWLDRATRDQVGSSGPPNGYGYLWWPLKDGFQASGRGGQSLYVLPSADVVVVTTGSAGSSQLMAQAPLQTELVSSISAEASLPANPSAAARLQAMIEAAGKPPAASTVSELPSASAWASAQTFQLEDNFLGWTALTLSFKGSEAELHVVVNGSDARAAVGLDGAPRVTRGIARFGADPRYLDLDLALVGRWTDDTTFEITFDTIDRIDAGVMRFDFAGGKLHVTVHEKTYLDTDITFSGVTG